MMRKIVWILAGLLALTQGTAFAQSTLLTEVKTVGADNAPVPVEHQVTIASAGAYEITLTDLGAPAAPLAEVQFAVTSGVNIIGTPRNSPGVLAFNAPAGGDYVVRVTGRPGSSAGSGLFRLQLRAAGGNTVLDEFVDVLALPAGVPNSSQFVFDAKFSAPVTGNYDIALRDLLWPHPMSTLLVAVIEEGGPLLAALDGVAVNPAQQSVALTAGTQYHLFAIGEAQTPSGGGLYSLRISGAGGAVVPFERNIGVAGVASLGEVTLAAGAHQLVTGDLVFPVALANLGANVIRGGQSVTSSLSAGTKDFTASAGLHQVFGFAEPTVTGGAGSLQAQVQPAGQAPVFSGVMPVTIPGNGIFPYSFDSAVVAGGYRLRLADYQFPATFTTVGIAATQNGAVLGNPLTAPGALDVTLAAGRVQLLAFARPAAGGGLFGVDLVPSGGGTAVIEATQGVGRVFTARKVTVTSTTNYDVTLTDVGFPANFGSLAAAVTRGTDRVGLIFGAGTFDFSATLGNYFINVVALPATNQSFGTYGIAVTEKPPAPVITFTATPSKATSGGNVQLSWTVVNSTACTASNAWSGAKSASGAEQTAALTATSTFTLTCSGTGGSAAQSVTVEVLPPTSGGGKGGGGATSVDLLLALGALLFLRVRSQRRADPIQ